MAMTVGSLRARIDADIDGALRGIRQVQREMKTLTKAETVVRVRLDISSARAQLQPFLQQLRNIQRSSLNTTVNLNIKTNMATARQNLLDFKKEANALKSLIKPIELRVNTRGSQKSLQPIITQLRSLQKTSAAINIKATVAEAMRNLQRVLDLLREIRKEAAVTIHLKIDGDTIRGLSDIQRRLAQLTGSGTNWGGHASGIRNLGREARDAGGALSRLKEILFAFTAGYLGVQGITAAFGVLKSIFIDFNNVLAQSNVGFTTLFANGGLSLQDAQQKANGLLETLKAFSIPTPFELVDLAPLAQQALAFNLVAKDSINVGAELTALLRDVGDAAYGLGRGKEGVDRVMLALGQMKVATRVMGQEMLQLQQIGINAWGYLAEALGKSTAEVRKLVEDGLVPADGAIKAIRAGLQRDFGGGMERAAQTLAGAVSQIRDTLKVKISDAFKPQFEDLTQLAVKIAQVLNTEAFDYWATQTMGKVEVALSFVSGAFQGLVAEIERGHPAIIAALTLIGMRFIWLEAVATRVAIAGIARFATTTHGQLIIAAAATAAFAAAYSNSMYGVRDTTDTVVSFLNRQLAGLSKGFAWFIEQLSGFLQKVPDFALDLIPGVGQGAKLLKNALGDMSGVAKDAETYWDEILASIKSPDGLSAGGSVKLDLFGDFKKMMADAQREAANVSKNVASTFGKVTIPGITLGAGDGGKDKAAKKAAADALRRLKDELGDSAKAWDSYASAVESAAERQIKALKGIQDSLVSVFDGLKQNLIQAGVISDPLQPIIDKLAGVLNLRGQATALAAAAQSRVDFARNMGNAARSQQERAGGLDGVVPTKYGTTTAHVANPGAAVLNEIADAVNTPMGAAACARFVSFAFKKMGIAVQTTDAAGQLVRNARKAGAREIPISEAGAGDLVYQYGRRYGVLKDSAGNGYHVGIGIGNGRIAAKNSNYLGPAWRNARALDTSVLADGRAALQARANATGQAQVGVRYTGSSAPQMPVESNLKNAAAEMIAGLSKIGAVPKGWGGAVQNTPQTQARFALQSLLTTEEGRSLIAALAPRIGGNAKNAPDQAAWFLRSEANKADAQMSASLMPSRIHEAGKATTEFVQAKTRELAVLRDSSKWLKANAFDALGLAQAQEESKVRAEAENDATLKGLPIKQRNWNITTRVKAAVASLVETYRHNAFAAHVQRVSELDREYATLGATTLQAQIAQKVWNQEGAASLTIDEKQLQVTKELRNERAKYAQEALQGAKAAATEARRALEDLDILNPGVALQKQFARADADRRLVDPGWAPSLELIRARSDQVAQTLKKWTVEGFRETLADVRGLMDDTELSTRKITQFLQGMQEKVSLGAAPSSARPGAGILSQLFGKAGVIESRNALKGITEDIEAFAGDANKAMQEFATRNLTPVEKAEDAVADYRAQLAATVGLMVHRGVDVSQFAGTFEYLERTLQGAVVATRDLDAATRAADYADTISELKRSMEQENTLGSILDPARRALEEWKISLREKGITDDDIEAILPARRIQLRAEEARGYIDQFLNSTQSTLSSSFDTLFTEGPGKFFSSLLSGLQSTLQQMASQILSSFVTSWITNMIGSVGGGALFGSVPGGGWNAPMALPGFSIGLPRVPFDDYAVRVHKDEAILTAQQANVWREQQRENAKIPSRSNGSGGAGAAVINAPVTYNVGTVVANNPQEFHQKLRERRGPSRGELQRDIALAAQRGARRL